MSNFLVANNNNKQKYSNTVLISQVFLYDKCQGLLYFSGMNETNDNNDVSLFIKRARKKMKMTQESFAEKFGCTKANVSAWENCLHEPSYKQLRKISKESSVPLPHDKIGLLMDKLGIDVNCIDIDQIDLLEATLSVPEVSRGQVKKIINAFKEPDPKLEEKKSGE